MTYDRNHRRKPVLAVAPKSNGSIAGRFALVASASRVNRIVVSRIIADCGVKAVEGDYAGAVEILRTSRPVLIVVDGYGAKHDVASVLDEITEMAQKQPSPPVIFMADGKSDELPNYPFQGVATMPFTSDSFAPLIKACVE